MLLLHDQGGHSRASVLAPPCRRLTADDLDRLSLGLCAKWLLAELMASENSKERRRSIPTLSQSISVAPAPVPPPLAPKRVAAAPAPSNEGR